MKRKAKFVPGPARKNKQLTAAELKRISAGLRQDLYAIDEALTTVDQVLAERGTQLGWKQDW
jgi:hypothetical protein